MIRLIGISGSLRTGSYNTALLRNATTLLPDDVAIDVHTLHGIPLYNADDEAADGIPVAVATLKQAIASADGVLLATPEYNNGIPGVFKNAIDWLSRPPADIPRLFTNRPFALIGASPGGFGTVLSQDAWLSVLRTLRTRTWFGGRLIVPHVAQSIDAEGVITSDAVRTQLRDFLAGFVAFVEREPAAEAKAIAD